MLNQNRLIAWLTAVVVVAIPLTVHAEVRLAQLFTQHALLQRDKPLPVWGWAEPGENIAVTFGSQQAEAVACKDGRWTVKLAAQAMSKEPLTLRVLGKNTVMLDNGTLIRSFRSTTPG